MIAASGLHYEVGPLGTSVEGEPDEVWSVVRRAHEATLVAGAEGVVSVIKVAQRVQPGTTIASLTDKFR
ncbi:MAG: thiamine-binding protein [Acidimicrobiales bacterium]